MSDGRFGVAIGAFPADLPAALSAIGLTAGQWYDYAGVFQAGGAPEPQWGHSHGLPQVGRLGLARYPMTTLELMAAAAVHPHAGAVWLCGNEPNLYPPAGDMCGGAQYAAWLQNSIAAIRSVDNTAQFIGGQTAYWTHAQSNITKRGYEWANDFLTAWGSAPCPLIAWSLHAYGVSGDGSDPQEIIAEALSCRAWLNQVGWTLPDSTVPLPLWLTEFGIPDWASDAAALVWLDAVCRFVTTQNVVSYAALFSLCGDDGYQGLVDPQTNAATALGQRYAEWARGEAT